MVRRVRARSVRGNPFWKKLGIIGAACLLIRFFVFLGAEAGAESLLYKLVSNESLVGGVAGEVGAPKDLAEGDMSAAYAAVIQGSPLIMASSAEIETILDARVIFKNSDESDFPSSEDTSKASGIAEAPDEPSIPGSAESADIQEATIVGGGSGYISAEGVHVKNSTSYEFDIEALLNGEINITLSSGEPQVLILHTHGSEAYSPDGDDVYTPSDPSRTEDTDYNVVRVGEELASALESCGVSVIHDRELYDYPSYSGSYSRSLESIKSYLEQYPSIKLVIDIHRDALESETGTIYKTVADIDGDATAQVMLVVGTDEAGLEHPQWQENLKLALRMQAAMNQSYPTLARPISLRTSRFNQHATTGSLLVEIGCSGNTLQEALNAVRLFAESAAKVILELVE